MSSPNNDETIAAPRQELREEDEMGGSSGPINVPLTATRSGNTIRVTGSGGASLAVDRPATRFNFTLTDNSQCNVKFASLLAVDDCSTCPPTSGGTSQQIVGVTMNNGATPKTAAFTDNNSNPAQNGPMDVAYQWSFTCDCPGVTVQPFDPIISNGGRSAG